MRILHIAPFLWPMGEKTGMPSVYLGLRGQLDAGHEVTLIAPGNQSAYDYENIRIYEISCNFNVTTSNRLVAALIQKYGIYKFLFLSTIKAFQVTRKNQPDLVYGHSFYGAYAAFFISWYFNVPYIYRGYGTFLRDYIRKPVTLLKRIESVIGFLLPADHRILTNDGTGYDEVAQFFKIPSDRYSFWMNGVDFNLYDPSISRDKFLADIGLDNSNTIVLAMSRLDGWKGVDRFIKAFPKIVKRCPHARGLIVGDGHLRSDLEKLCDDLGMKSYIKFCGSVPRSQIGYYLNTADVFVTLYDLSNIGNPLLEAMICGRAVVALATGATDQVIQDGVNGRLVNPNQMENLPGIVAEIIENASCRARLGKGAREYAMANFNTWDERVHMEVKKVEDIVYKRIGGSDK